MGRGVAWLDAGTHESLLQAANFVQAVEERQGMMISCPEEIAYRLGFIETGPTHSAGERYRGNQYGEYLLQLLDEKLPIYEPTEAPQTDAQCKFYCLAKTASWAGNCAARLLPLGEITCLDYPEMDLSQAQSGLQAGLGACARR